MAIYNYDKTTYSQVNNVPGFSYSRSGTAYQQNASGVWTSFDENVPPINAGVGLGVWEARTNSIRNPTGLGAVVGTPGTLPTNWAGGLAAGLSLAVAGVGVENELPYVDLRIYGTPSAAATSIVFFESADGIAASNTQTWGASLSTKLVSGDPSNFTAFEARVELRDAASAFLLSANFGPALPLTGVLTRSYAPYTIATASAAFIRTGFSAYHPTNAAIDVTVRVAAPNLKLGADIADPPILQTNNAAATRGAASAYLNAPGLLVPPFAVVAWFQAPSVAASEFRRVFSVNDGTMANRCDVYISSGQRVRGYSLTGGVQQADFGNRVAAIGTQTKVAMRVKTDNLGLAVNGLAVELDTSATLPTQYSRIQFGDNPENLGTRRLNSNILRLQIINRDVTDAELQALTTA